MISQEIYSIVLFLLLAGIWTFIGQHVSRIRENLFLSGSWFGLLSILANHIRLEDSALQIALGFCTIPPILSAFYFHPAAGLVTGVYAAAGKILGALCRPGAGQTFLILNWGEETLPWQIGVPAVLLTAAYAAGMAQWIFEKKRPTALVAAIAAAYGIIQYFCVIILLSLRLGHFAKVLLVLYVGYPTLPLIAGLTAGFAALISTRCKEWRSGFFAPLAWGFLLFGIVFAIMANMAVMIAYNNTDKALRLAVKNLDIKIEDQIAILLHHRAEALKSRLEKEPKITMSVLQKLANEYKINEVNLFAADGRLIATSDKKVWHGNQASRDPGVLKPFFELTSGKRNFVKSKFRLSRSNDKVRAKYIGLPFRERISFLQLGYYWKRLEQEFGTFFLPMFDGAKVETSGCFIVTDSAGRVAAEVAGHPDARGKKLAELSRGQDFREMPPRTIREVNLFNVYGRIYRCRDIGPWQIYAFLPYQEKFDDALLIMMSAALLLFMIGIVIRLEYLHTARIQEKLDEMREADLRLASTIQNSELQQDALETAACRVSAAMTPAKEVGGDFYDYYLLPDGRVAVTVADVSGKGVPAAFFMIKAKSLLKNELLKGGTLPAAVAEANRRLNVHNDAFMFVTAWVGIFDPANGRLEYVSAGHNPPLVRRADGNTQWLTSARRQKPLAAFAKSVYDLEQITLAIGDRLFLYTDGVTEAMNKKGELFGTDRLEEALRKNSGDLMAAVTAGLKAFTAGASQADDITTLTLEVKTHELDC